MPVQTPGAIHISGTIYDGAGVPIPDFLLETWQADPDGRFADMYGYGGPSELEGFRGFARYGVEDGDGTFDIVTVKPGPGPAHLRRRDPGAAHRRVRVRARHAAPLGHPDLFRRRGAGQRRRPGIGPVPAERRATLIAQPDNGGYGFDIRFQGPDETVFFAV